MVKEPGLLQEEATYENIEFLSEAKDNGQKKYKLKGEFGRFGVPNKNKRIYPKEVYEVAINENSEIVTARGMMGELDHPPTPKVNLDRVSHVVTALKLEEDGRLYGEAEVLDTPSGEILKALIDGGVRIGVSSRGYGKVLRKGDLLEVAPGYKMITFDIVADPSSQKAFPEPVYEDVEVASSEPKVTVKNIIEDVLK